MFPQNISNTCKTTQQHKPKDFILFHNLLDESVSYFDVEHIKSVSGIHFVNVSETEVEKCYGRSWKLLWEL